MTTLDPPPVVTVTVGTPLAAEAWLWVNGTPDEDGALVVASCCDELVESVGSLVDGRVLLVVETTD